MNEDEKKMKLEELYSIIAKRLKTKPKNSYVAALAKNGEDAILQKVGEEATEVLIASKNADKQRIIEEVSDLYFMTLILLAYEGIPLKEIFDELEKRRRKDLTDRF